MYTLHSTHVPRGEEKLSIYENAMCNRNSKGKRENEETGTSVYFLKNWSTFFQDFIVVQVET